MPTYLRTTLVGDDTGKVFSDIALANADGALANTTYRSPILMPPGTYFAQAASCLTMPVCSTRREGKMYLTLNTLSSEF